MEVIPITEKKKETKIPQNISIDPDLRDTLVTICQLEDRSISSLVRIAIKQYIAAHYPDGVK